jgi:hypothetical protein
VAGTCGYGEGISGSINAGNFLTSCKVYWLASQEGLCSMVYGVLSSVTIITMLDRLPRKCVFVCLWNHL